VYFSLFFVSGMPALIYQIVWERALFTIYGVNIESVTMTVTVFLLGLGLGSLAGGKLSMNGGLPLLRTFGAIELCVGVFGAFSLGIFHRAASYTAGASLLVAGTATFGLLLLPTLLMGSTLPLLAAYLTRQTNNVGQSVGALYCVNTLGSAVACWLAAAFLMRDLGESGSVRLAAVMNGCVGVAALLLSLRTQAGHNPPAKESAQIPASVGKALPFGLALLIAGAVGFISLAFEVIWYRLYSFASGGAAPVFAKMLAFYLAGIAYGSFAARDICRNKPGLDTQRRALNAGSTAILVGSAIGLLVGPALSFSSSFLPYDLTWPLIFIGAALLGSAFPLLAHASIAPDESTGSKISYLYLANIVGSALGSFLVGFVVLNFWTTPAASALLLLLGIAVSVFLALLTTPSLTTPSRWSPVRIAGWSTALILALLSGFLFSHGYERLLFKKDAGRGVRLSDLVENRNGVIAVTDNGTVFGGGVYDGKFNTSLIDDTNGVFRAYAIAGLHPDPAEVLIIGLSSGSWAQIVAAHAKVRRVTIVEINPGYVPLIQERPEVATLLRNPKVHLEIDDGRRWLVAHPNRQFDFILMNTSYNWRANMSNLLSVEFLRLMRAHLRPGGVAYYNTTWSAEVQATGAAVFPYALRIANFLAVSDAPLELDQNLWRQALTDYKIDGKPVLDLSKKTDRERLEEVIALPDVESGADLRHRVRGVPLITDDNMGTEWH
jgi:spermidine synthase